MTTNPQSESAEPAETSETTEAPAATGAVPAVTKRRGPWRAVGIAAAVGVVGLLVGGGAGYLAWHDGSDSPSSGSASGGSDLSLPSTLSGGYQRSTQVDSQLESAVSSAQTALGAGTDMALYAKGKTQMLVEATRLPGNALLQAGMTYSKVGDAVCATGTSSSGSEAICSRSSGALTVKVTAATADVASKYADTVFSSLA